MLFKNTSLKWKLGIGTGVPLVLLVFLSIISIRSSDMQVGSSAMVDHTHKVIEHALQIEAAAVNMETGMRGFLLAGKEDFLAPYTQGKQDFSKRVNELKLTVNDNPAQVRRLTELESTINDWVTQVTEPTIELRRIIGDAKTMDDVADIIGEAKGKVFFDKFREQIGTFEQRERVLLEQRKNVSEANHQKSVTLLAQINNAGTVNTFKFNQLNRAMDELASATQRVSHSYDVIEKNQQLLSAAVDMETGMRGFLLSGQASFLTPYNEGRKRFDSILNELKQTVADNPAQVTLLEEMQTTINEWDTVVVKPNIELRTIIGDSKTMNDMAKLVGEARGKVFFDKFRNQIAEFINVEKRLMVERQAAAVDAAENANTTIVTGTLMALIFGVGVSWVVFQSISTPVAQVAQGLSELANGNLTHQITVETTDEIGTMAASYNQAVTKTNQVMKQVLETTEQVVSESQTITETNNLMASDLEDQSQQVTQIASAIDQMSLSIQDVAHKSADATLNAKQAGESANTGGEVVESTITGMNAIDTAVTASSASVSELGKRGAEIGDVINVINDIAEQTNLLALNAAIEAARAGEAGRGFAVVADEVRALADRTTTATKDIGESITSIQQITQQAVEKMASGAQLVQEGLGYASKAGSSLSDIVSGAEDVASKIDSIAAAAEQQSQASSEISQRIESVAQVSQSSNAQANNAAASAQELAQRAEVLRSLVNQFKV
ncbi:CHASE3 domain-containing protein [Vibrio sp. SCSIO 43136]|uniref:CHASE3 domain-containing protein n=1 Tax=Vibrio sp. SCSIO 43136 TaxID=2819101 RepID=UPI002074B0F1|nr:CHASE3 domain-containing protein [Vibrio sp. SCSIO 43136]USD68212.1 methyl-accepting chemotaxis protein [Vibrio sp. SCSIO 43136]